MNQLGREILETTDPKIRMMWLACRNPFSQDPDTTLLKKAFDTLEMVVVVDQFSIRVSSRPISFCRIRRCLKSTQSMSVIGTTG